MQQGCFPPRVILASQYQADFEEMSSPAPFLSLTLSLPLSLLFYSLSALLFFRTLPTHTLVPKPLNAPCCFETLVKKNQHINYRLCLMARTQSCCHFKSYNRKFEGMSWFDRYPELLRTHSSIFQLQFLEIHTITLPLTCTSLDLVSPALGSLLPTVNCLSHAGWRTGCLGHSRDSQHFLLLMIYPFISTLTRRRRE